jgi:hypothetical protein
MITSYTHRLMQLNTKIDLKGIVCEDVNWIDLAQDRYQWWAVANAVMNLRVP